MITIFTGFYNLFFINNFFYFELLFVIMTFFEMLLKENIYSMYIIWKKSFLYTLEDLKCRFYSIKKIFKVCSLQSV